ncbi:hypothetical protein DFH08DRAFT_182598 [Mycena albidolilacea]|uniref:Uncharacterized protein n=1 Tax=Mycena albidolilacea TaxID=1033008 RepID=A0AAD7F3J6_9AGAR|nr:hypothetical protein DFH08DRAFT_182598 [Mycena albidolilacea]
MKPYKTYGLLERDSGEKAPFDSASGATIQAGSMHFNLLATAAGALYAIQAFTDEASARMNNLTELHVVFPVCTVVLLAYLHLAFGRSVESSTWSSVALQLSGLYMVKSTVDARFNHSAVPVVTSFAVATSLALITSYYTLRRLEGSLVSFARLAAGTVIAKLVFAVAIASIDGFASPKAPLLKTSSSLDLSGVLLFIAESCRGICIFLALDGYDVIFVAVLLTFANTVWLAISALFSQLFSFGVLGGCAIALTASSLHLRQPHRSDETTRESFRPLRFIGITASLILTLLVSLLSRNSDEIQYPPSVSQLFRFEASHPKCYPRKPPASLRPLWQSGYHEFDNVLLIVFFSHPRYDVNLEFHKEVYSKYFPNVVFIGPANREDAGFKHSFDAVVNSYHSKEELPQKMSGRMAHHMLYQVMEENPCGYDGYLWAPFDAFLNVPRLQQFDKTRFWYHSPWAKYVYNPATAASQDTRHAPPLGPASPAPDPYPANPADLYKYDWWWGSKEVGLEVCLPAFEKIPLHMRQRMATHYTNGKTRLVGGSSDTMYIPGRHAKTFRQTLALFLETTCFLEIAAPTTLHLVAPPKEPIQFVDHYWEWQPPYNATFVRQKWASGFEVDTFHTFHWGEPGADGVWRAQPGIVEDTRRVLAESAARQGIHWD